MTALALKRAAFQPLALEEGWYEDLLQEAAALVGYKPKALELAKATRERHFSEVAFAEVLKKLDIQPFTVASVMAYKQQKLQEARKNESWNFTRYMHRSGRSEMEAGQTVVHVVGWPSWIVFGMAGITVLCLHFNGVNVGWGWDGHKSVEIVSYLSWINATHLMTVPALAVGAWGWLMYLRHKNGIRVDATWRVYDVNRYYEEAIPAFAVQRMVSLKKELPDVTFQVEQLNATEVPLRTEKAVRPLPPDPFLIATYNGVSAYIDVWDEPKFEGRRTL